MSFDLDDDFDPDEFMREEVPAALPEVPKASGTTETLPVLPAVTEAPASLPAVPKKPRVKLDPVLCEQYGLDPDYDPGAAASGSSFATDLEDDEPVHVFEIPPELREFMDSQEAKSMPPNELTDYLIKALQEETAKLHERFDNLPAPQVVSVPAEPQTQVVEHRIITEPVPEPPKASLKSRLIGLSIFAWLCAVFYDFRWAMYVGAFVTMVLFGWACYAWTKETFLVGIAEAKSRKAIQASRTTSQNSL
jgi:hypothetical protein